MPRPNEYKLYERPAVWVSAHRRILWRYDLPKKITLGLFDNAGNMRITFNSSFTDTIVAGDIIYLGGVGSFTGYHTIKSVASQTDITLETAYQNKPLNPYIYLRRLPIVNVYKGWMENELIINGVDMFTIQPYTLVATFEGNTDANGKVRIDLNGYAQASLPSPYKGRYNQDEVNYNIENGNKYELTKNYTILRHYFGTTTFAGTLKGTNYVANAAITTEDLNRYYVDANDQAQVGFTSVLIDGLNEFQFINNLNMFYGS